MANPNARFFLRFYGTSAADIDTLLAKFRASGYVFVEGPRHPVTRSVNLLVPSAVSTQVNLTFDTPEHRDQFRGDEAAMAAYRACCAPGKDGEVVHRKPGDLAFEI